MLYLVDDVGGQDVDLAQFSLAFLGIRAVRGPPVDRLGGTLVARCVLVIEAAGLLLLTAATSMPVALTGAAIAIGLALAVTLVLPHSRDRQDGAHRAPGRLGN